jgi:hypothetical protein
VPRKRSSGLQNRASLQLNYGATIPPAGSQNAFSGQGRV